MNEDYPYSSPPRAARTHAEIVSDLQRQLTEATARAEQAEASLNAERKWVQGIIAAYRDDYSAAACDECENCGSLVMCHFHSLLSLLNRGTHLASPASTEPKEEKDEILGSNG